MRALAGSLRSVPISLWIFSALHVLIGSGLLWGLFASRCVGDPCPPGGGCLDGCSSLNDPWRAGRAPYYLVLYLFLILTSLWLLRLSRYSRLAFVVALIALIGYLLVSAKELMDAMSEAEHGRGATWNELFGFATPLQWSIPLWWIILDAWFLYGSRVRKRFQEAA